MEKRKEKSELEQLLNSLIEKGWKPRQHTDFVRCNYNPYSRISFETENESGIGEYTLKALVSKESNLWQFVCENGMVLKHIEKICINPYNNDGRLGHGEYDYKDYQYWIMSCSLKDESELESFILDNIKVEG